MSNNRRSVFARVLTAMLVVSAVFVSQSPAFASAKPGYCKVTGSGTIPDRLSFQVSLKADQITNVATGKATVTSASGDVYVLTTTAMFCSRESIGGVSPGSPAGWADTAEIEGTATINGVPGFDFAAQLQDLGEASTGGGHFPVLDDTFAITVAQAPDDTNIVLRDTGFVGGNVQVQMDAPS